MDRREFNKVITSILAGSFTSVNLANASEKDQIYSINIQAVWSADKLWDDFEYFPTIELTLETNTGKIRLAGKDSFVKFCNTPPDKNWLHIFDTDSKEKENHATGFRINNDLKFKDLKLNKQYTLEILVKTPKNYGIITLKDMKVVNEFEA